MCRVAAADLGNRIAAGEDGVELTAGGHVSEIREPLLSRRGARDVHSQAEEAPTRCARGRDSVRRNAPHRSLRPLERHPVRLVA